MGLLDDGAIGICLGKLWLMWIRQSHVLCFLQLERTPFPFPEMVNDFRTTPKKPFPLETLDWRQHLSYGWHLTTQQVSAASSFITSRVIKSWKPHLLTEAASYLLSVHSKASTSYPALSSNTRASFYTTPLTAESLNNWVISPVIVS